MFLSLTTIQKEKKIVKTTIKLKNDSTEFLQINEGEFLVLSTVHKRQKFRENELLTR